MSLQETLLQTLGESFFVVSSPRVCWAFDSDLSRCSSNRYKHPEQHGEKRLPPSQRCARKMRVTPQRVLSLVTTLLQLLQTNQVQFSGITQPVRCQLDGKSLQDQRSQAQLYARLLLLHHFMSISVLAHPKKCEFCLTTTGTTECTPARRSPAPRNTAMDWPKFSMIKTWRAFCD